MLLKDKVTIITGGGRGIGKAVAQAMARQGAAIVVAARTVSEVESVAREIQSEGGTALAVPADVTHPTEVEHLVTHTLDTFGQIDVLVNNAGTPGGVALVQNLTIEDWDKTIHGNLRSTFLCTRAVLKHLMAQRRGKILNVASSLATNVLPGMSAYSAAKAGVVHFSRVLAAEVAECNIQVNAVWPGVVDTRFHDTLRNATVEQAGQVLYDRARVRPSLGPEACAPLFVFLASEAANDITGQFVLLNDHEIEQRIQAMGGTITGYLVG